MNTTPTISTIYLALNQGIDRQNVGGILNGYLTGALGIDSTRVAYFTNEALAQLRSKTVYLTPEGLSYYASVPAIPEDISAEALQLAKSLEVSSRGCLKFSSNYIGMNVAGMAGIDALALGQKLQTAFFRGGDYAYCSSILHLGTEETIEGIMPHAVKISHSGKAVPAATLDELLERIKAAQPILS